MPSSIVFRLSSMNSSASLGPGLWICEIFLNMTLFLPMISTRRYFE